LKVTDARAALEIIAVAAAAAKNIFFIVNSPKVD
jgi:hypothetical protein